MAVEIACGNCGNTFGVEAEWANLIVQCPFCSAAVQVPAEVANWGAATPGPGDQPEPPAVVEPPASHPPGRLPAETGAPAAIDWQAIAPAVPESKSLTPDFSRLARGVEPPPPSPAAAAPESSKPTRAKPARSKRTPSTPAAPTTTAAGATADAPAVATSAAVSITPPTVAATIAAVPPLVPVPADPPQPRWTSPPTSAWLAAGNADSLRVVVNEGTTTIHYHGQRVVLRAEPTAARWYGLTSFVLSILTLVVLLTWMYFVYR